MDYRDSSEGALRAIELPPPLDRKMSLDEQWSVRSMSWGGYPKISVLRGLLL